MLFSASICAGYWRWATAAGDLLATGVFHRLMSLAINARLLRASMLEVSSQRHVVWASAQAERGQVERRRAA